MTQTFREWQGAADGLDIRAVLCEDAEFRASPGSDLEVRDLWILFASITAEDRWLAFGVVDSLIDEPQAALSHQDGFERLKKLSILIGDRWLKLEQDPLSLSIQHRKLIAEIEVVIDDVLDTSYAELTAKRSRADWETLRTSWIGQHLKLTLN